MCIARRSFGVSEGRVYGGLNLELEFSYEGCCIPHEEPLYRLVTTGLRLLLTNSHSLSLAEGQPPLAPLRSVQFRSGRVLCVGVAAPFCACAMLFIYFIHKH